MYDLLAIYSGEREARSRLAPKNKRRARFRVGHARRGAAQTPPTSIPQATERCDDRSLPEVVDLPQPPGRWAGKNFDGLIWLKLPPISRDCLDRAAENRPSSPAGNPFHPGFYVDAKKDVSLIGLSNCVAIFRAARRHPALPRLPASHLHRCWRLPNPLPSVQPEVTCHAAKK